MRSEFGLTDRSNVADKRPETQTSNVEVDQIRENIQQTQHDSRRTRQALERHVERCESGFQRVRILWAVVILVALSLLALSWFSYAYKNESRSVLSDFPTLQKLTGNMGDRMAAIEGSLTNWAADRAGLADRLTGLEASIGSNAKIAKTQAKSFAAQMGQRVREEVGQNLRAIQSRLSGVESVQHETQDHVSQLQGEIGNLRQEVASLQQQNAQQFSELQEKTKADLDRVNNQMNNQFSAQTNKLKVLNDQVERQHVGFEITNNRTQQIAPGIYVTVKHTDVARQSVDGWMQLADEGRIVWIRQLSAQQPMTFVTRSDNRTQQLVFTRIGQDGASGYVLLPVAVEKTSESASR